MTTFPATMASVRELITIGEAVVGTVSTLAEPMQLGLWSQDSSTGRIMARTGLVQLAARLPNFDESVAAPFACQSKLRFSWFRIVAARLREAGKRRDTDELCNAIELLGEASRMIREAVPNVSLQPSGHQLVEIALFGASAEQAVVWPKLLRVIGATTELVEGKLGHPLVALPTVAPLDPKRTWCNGRLLQLPIVDRITTHELKFVLDGNCGPLSAAEAVADDIESQAVMRWVLYRPWIMLLAQVVFVQEAWEAEQISGRLTLELGEDQLANPYEPSRVDVVVTTPDGDEILCGTLGDMVRRVLARLDVTLLARPEDAAQLDQRLAQVVHLLLEKKIWRFEAGASGGRRPGFVIDDEFSTSCYRVFGSKYFYRLGSVLTAAIRSTCEQWAREKLSESGMIRGRDLPEFIAERVTG